MSGPWAALPRLPALKLWSLRARLLSLFSLLLLGAWLVAAVLAWNEGRKYIDEFFDTQQILLAKTLSIADWGQVAPHLPKTRPLLRGAGKKARGHEDKDALAFAVFDQHGRSLLTDGEKGGRFRFEPERRGFVDTPPTDTDDAWRIFWLNSSDGQRVVAVGQEREFRQDMALDMLMEQMLPWMLLLPLLSGGLFWMLHKELRPLRQVTAALAVRPPEDATPLPVEGMPSEVRPLTSALNTLFARTASLLQRERAFISDAAHELRTPLAGLRIQAEVIALYEDDATARQHAIAQMLLGIERSSRLVEQLLTLSRLDALAAPPNAPQNTYQPASPAGSQAAPSVTREALHWQSLLTAALEEAQPAARSKGLHITLHEDGAPQLTQGFPGLMAILLRNVLDNAVKYTPAGGQVRVCLSARSLSVENSGPGVAENLLPRLGERFFRPPGQEAPGSGLGLAMVRQIAALHGCTLHLENTHEPQGFAVRLVFTCVS